MTISFCFFFLNQGSNRHDGVHCNKMNNIVLALLFPRLISKSGVEALEPLPPEIDFFYVCVRVLHRPSKLAWNF